MWKFFRKLLRYLYIGAALLVIMLAIGVGAFRLVVTQLPSYRGEIQAWAREELGLTMDFSRLDARWALLGPEITFYDVSVSIPGGESEPLFSAREARIGLSALALVTERRLVVNRLTVVDTRLVFERGTDGTLRLQGAPSQQAASTDLTIEDLPPVEIIVRDSTVVYEDRVQGRSWEFLDVRLGLAREADRLRLEARADPPAELGSRIDVSAEGSVIEPEDGTGREWRIFAELRDLDLSTLTTLFPDQRGMPRSGVGDVSVWLDFLGGRVSRATVQLELENLLLAQHPGFNDADSSYEILEVTTEWSRDDRGWQLALSNLNLRRQRRSWPGDVIVNLSVAKDSNGLNGLVLSSSFLRLEDLTPLIAALPEYPVTDLWVELAPVGDVLGVQLDWTSGAESWVYSASADFRDIGFATYGKWPGVMGLSGELRAVSRSGRLALQTRNARVRWPAIFREELDIEELTGIVIWRQGQDGIRLVSDNLTLNNQDMTTRSNFEITIPLDGSSPRLELESNLFGFDTAKTSQYLPAGVLPAPVVAWLDRAVIGGYIPRAEVEFVGPVAAFPFREGEGRFWATFDIEDGELAFMEGWPAAEDIRGTVEFLNEGLTARGTGRILGEDRAYINGSVADMRDAVVRLEGVTAASLDGVLEYLKEIPLFAKSLGPDITQLKANAGDADVELALTLPLTDLAAYELDAQLRIQDGELSVGGSGLAITEIQGVLNLKNDGVTAAGIKATLLDGPVVVGITRSDEPGYRARVEFAGEIAAESVGAAFNLPLNSYLDGQTRWQGSLLLPANPAPDAPVPRAPLRVSVSSNLLGVALKFPEPFTKLPAEATSFQADIIFSQPERVDIEGNLGAANRFALSLWNRAEGLSLRKGSVRFGGSYPLLLPQDGLDIQGELGQVRLDDWLDLFAEVASETGAAALLTTVDLEIADFSVFSQPLGQTTLAVRREPTEWLVDIDSEPVAGRIVMPLDLSSRAQIVATMQRLHLSTNESGESSQVDPRDLPGLLVTAGEFAVGARHYGELNADIRAEASGLRLASFRAVSEGFTLEGSGQWSDGAQGVTTRLTLTLNSGNVAVALEELALDPILEGELAEVSANVYWPGGPSADWRQGISGDVTLRLEQGSVLDLEPGAGRMMGLMSISALPRRLALDFRDVFNRGLVFDEVSGNFVLIDGDAYTDNLRLTGPVADIGVVGRTGLKDQTYQQQAVVTAEPGKILPTMGFLAGPGIGAALLIFTQIFKEPLKGIGRAFYCMSGTWSEPLIERLSPEDLSTGELCADLPPGWLHPVQE